MRGRTPASGGGQRPPSARPVLADNGYCGDWGDNGYCGKQFREVVFERKGHQIWASPRPNQKTSSRTEAQARRWLRAKQDLIETVIAMLADQFKLETTRARSLWEVMTWLGAKQLASNLTIFLNKMLGQPLLAHKDLYL